MADHLSTHPADDLVVRHDAGFDAVLGDAFEPAVLARTDAHEGPVYDAAADALFFTTAPRAGRVDVRRLELAGDPVDEGRLTTVVADAAMANGMAAGGGRTLLVCEQGDGRRPARIARLDVATGVRETVVDGWRGLPLGSPNDVVRRGDGTIWFTDPSYGHLQGFRPPPALADAVYRHDPRTGVTDVVAVGLDKPNGLAFAPDGGTLYVADSGAVHGPGDYDPARPHHVLAYDVLGGRRLGPPRLAAAVAPGYPDGLAVDADGRLYVACDAGVQVFTAGGHPLGEIRLPGAVNLTFGGAGRNVLLVTADVCIWAVPLGAVGLDEEV